MDKQVHHHIRHSFSGKTGVPGKFLLRIAGMLHAMACRQKFALEPMVPVSSPPCRVIDSQRCPGQKFLSCIHPATG